MQKNSTLRNIVIFTFVTFLFVTPIIAASPPPSPSPSMTPIPSVDVTENLKQRLKDTLKISEVSTTKIQPYTAYIGTVKDIIGTTIIIEDKDGKKDLKIESDATLLRSPGNSTIKAENIQIDDSIIAIGNLDEANILLGKRIIVSTKKIDPPTKNTELGTISKIAKTNITLKIGESDTKNITTTQKTIIKTPVGTVDLSELKIGDKIVYTAKIDAESKEETATNIMRIGSGSL